MIFMYRAIDDQGELRQGLKESASKGRVREDLER